MSAMPINIKKGQTVSLAHDNAPIAGCTVSQAVGDDATPITIFALAEGTDISAESYPTPVAHLTLTSGMVYAGRVAVPQGGMVLTDADCPFGVAATGDCVFIEIGLNDNRDMNPLLKKQEAFRLKDLVPYQEGKVVNMDVLSNDRMKFVVMSFDAGCALREHAAPGDAIVFCLDGEGVIGYEGKQHTLHEGEQFVFEKGGMHSVTANSRFKMALLLTL